MALSMQNAIREALIEQRDMEFIGTLKSDLLKLQYRWSVFVKEFLKVLTSAKD